METGNRFLVIDDSYIDRLVSGMLIKRTFDAADIHEASDGQQGLEWLQTQKEFSENRLIILLDIMMPRMNGFEFLDRFHELDQDVRAGITIVMLSSSMDTSDRKRAEKYPSVKKLLSKPLSVNELKELILT